MVDPFRTIVQRDSGTSDMGTLSASAPTEVARFRLIEQPFCLSWLRVHFTVITGSGGTATLAVNLDSGTGVRHDTELLQITGAGKDNDVNLRIADEELKDWVFQRGDAIVLTWTNPDDGNVAWGAEVGLLDATAFAN